MASQTPHTERKHSKFSASGAERWFACPGSVKLSEGIPSKDSVWSIEGTIAHEVLEKILTAKIKKQSGPVKLQNPVNAQMAVHGQQAASFIYGLHQRRKSSHILVETRIQLPFIHPEAFGTFDAGIVDPFGILDVIDYKYGAGHSVSPRDNLQMIFYGLGLAYKYDWNFQRVRLWIIQPRIRGYDGPVFWQMPILQLKNYVPVFKKAVQRVEKEPNTFVEGSHCHWCVAKRKCPLKTGKRVTQAKDLFAQTPVT